MLTANSFQTYRKRRNGFKVESEATVVQHQPSGHRWYIAEWNPVCIFTGISPVKWTEMIVVFLIFLEVLIIAPFVVRRHRCTMKSSRNRKMLEFRNTILCSRTLTYPSNYGFPVSQRHHIALRLWWQFCLLPDFIFCPFFVAFFVFFFSSFIFPNKVSILLS